MPAHPCRHELPQSVCCYPCSQLCVAEVCLPTPLDDCRSSCCKLVAQLVSRVLSGDLHQSKLYAPLKIVMKPAPGGSWSYAKLLDRCTLLQAVAMALPPEPDTQRTGVPANIQWKLLPTFFDQLLKQLEVDGPSILMLSLHVAGNILR